jgi:tetratricopeptide (TPR) repeat protein
MDILIQRALQNVLKDQASAEEIKLLRQAFSSGQISVHGNVRNSVIIVGNSNKVQLTAKALRLLTAANESNNPPALHQLPRPPQDFVGRERELQTILNNAEKNIGTAISGLVGMGGIGKTALGLIIAHRLMEQYSDAQIFIDVRGEAKDPLHPDEIMKLVILSFYPRAKFRKSAQELAARYRSVLAGKKAILFFDSARDASQIGPLLPPKNCFMLVTSRHRFTLPGLQSVALDVLNEASAVQLLMENCRRVSKRDARHIANLCGFLPLALHLVAGCLQVNDDWRIKDYIARLSDSARRLRALRVDDSGSGLEATFEQSFQQLSENEQRYWSILSIFPTSFKRDAIAAVWGLDDETALDILSRLHRLCLLEFDSATDKYHLHDLLRDFAATKLTGEDKPSAFLNYLRHYQSVWAVAEEQYAKGGDNTRTALLLFDSEFEHLKRAYEWALANTNTDAVSALLAKIPKFYNIAPLRLQPNQRLEWLQASLTAAEKLEDFSSQNMLLGHIGTSYDDLASYPEAIAYYERALEMTRRIGDQEKEGFWLGNMGAAYSSMGQIPKALGYLEQALEIARRSGHKINECDCLNNIAMSYTTLGEIRKAVEYLLLALEIANEIDNRERKAIYLANIGADYINLGQARKALEYLKEARKIARRLGDLRREEFSLGTIGIALMNLGDFDKALVFFNKALKVARQDGNRRNEQNWMANIGEIHLERGDHDKALKSLEPALAIAREIHDRQSEGEWQGYMGIAHALRGEYHEAKEYLEQALVIARELGARWQEAQWQIQLGELYVSSNEPLEARACLDDSLRISKEMGIPILEASSLSTFAKLYKSQENKELALQYAQEARAIFESLESPEVKKVDEFIKSLK